MVDDGSTVDVAAVVAAAAQQGPFELRCERLELTGLNGARNRGAALARGDVLAFLDDDTLVSPRLGAALLEAFEQHPCAAVGGKVELALDGPAPDWLASPALLPRRVRPRRRAVLARRRADRRPRLLAGRRQLRGPPHRVRAARRVHASGSTGSAARSSPTATPSSSDACARPAAGCATSRRRPSLHCVPADRLTVDFFLRRHYAQGVSDELLLDAARRAGAGAGRGSRWEADAISAAAHGCPRMLLRGRAADRRPLPGQLLGGPAAGARQGRQPAPARRRPPGPWRPMLATNHRCARAGSFACRSVVSSACERSFGSSMRWRRSRAGPSVICSIWSRT